MNESERERTGGATGSTGWIGGIAVGVRMLWGVWMTLKKAALLFR